VPTTLVYDGDCGICQASTRLLERAGCVAVMVPSREWVRTHPEDAVRAETSVLLVSPDGTTIEAEHAVAGALRLSRQPLPLVGWFIELPGARVVAHRVYRVVATHRRRLSTTLGLTACALPGASP
jgi:predicted DCC family thiol-disulfide oxidoreductase YuxK